MNYPRIDLVGTGINIKKLMILNNFKIHNLANTIGVTDIAVYRWIEGRTIPSIDNLLILSKIFDCNIEDIIVTEESNEKMLV